MNFEIFQNSVLSIKNKLFRFALRFVGNEEEAKDIVQEVFIRVWNKRNESDTIENMEAWCMRITKNLSLDRVRFNSKRNTQPIEVGINIEHDDLTPYQKIELQESMNRIHELMVALPEKQRNVMHLRDVEGYSYNEISEILELDMSQVKINLFRARNTIREKLTQLNTYGV